MDRCTTPQDLLDGLRSEHIFGRRTPYLFSVATCGLWYIDRFKEFLAKSGQVRWSPRHQARHRPPSRSFRCAGSCG